MKLRICLFLLICSVATHLYLALHYYDLALGLGVGEGLCNINSVFSCDAATASSYATLLGIPLAAWGAASNIVLLLFVFSWMVRFAEDLPRLSSITFIFSSFVAAASIVMGLISFFLIKVYCPFCLLAYALSFITWFIIYLARETDPRSFSKHISSIFGENKSYLYMFVAVPALSYMVDWGASQQFRNIVSPQAISDSISDWQASRSITINAKASITRGAKPEDAKLTVVEFADFLCPHCKFASKSFKVFMQTRPDIRFEFFSFPLDGSCNSDLSAGNGVRCYLAKLVICSEKQEHRGWASHDLIFEEQENLSHRSSVNEAKGYLEPKLTNIGLNIENLNSCIDSTSTTDALKAQIELAKSAGIRGTPAFLFNSKVLSNAQFSKIMEKAYQMAQEKP